MNDLDVGARLGRMAQGRPDSIIQIPNGDSLGLRRNDMSCLSFFGKSPIPSSSSSLLFFLSSILPYSFLTIMNDDEKSFARARALSLSLLSYDVT